MGKALGSQIGEVLESAVYELSDKAKFVKIKMLFDVSHPIRAGMYIENQVDGVTWVDFRFENLPMFCFYCGLVGHIEENCTEKLETGEEADIDSVNPRGSWLRSNNYGRRIVEKSEKTFRSNIRNSLSGGQFSHIPKGLTEMMADLKVHTENQDKVTNDQTQDAMLRQNKTPTGTGTIKEQIKTKRKAEATTGTMLNFTDSKNDNLMMAGLVDKASQGQ